MASYIRPHLLPPVRRGYPFKKVVKHLVDGYRTEHDGAVRDVDQPVFFEPPRELRRVIVDVAAAHAQTQPCGATPRSALLVPARTIPEVTPAPVPIKVVSDPFHVIPVGHVTLRESGGRGAS